MAADTAASIVSQVTQLPLGARLTGTNATFCVWAPYVGTIDLVLDGPRRETCAMLRTNDGYFTATLDDVESGQRYGYRIDGGDVVPDPATRCQPDGVHGMSAVQTAWFDWSDSGWVGLPLEEYVLYELHPGTFTPEGTLDAAAQRIPALRDLGVTVIELMPLAQYPGARNWGYDGVHPFAVQNSYGGPDALKRFVNACHREGLAVCLDVVHNHIGPEGSHLHRFGPYFTGRYATPWGDALNFDGSDSEHVREYFIESALQWVDEYRIDALRLDAVHAIADNSTYPFLRALAERVHERAHALGRTVCVIAESDLADPRIVRPVQRGGLGMDGQWLDDFHHALHTLLTGERDGYYQDYGGLEHLARAYARGYVYAGEYSPYRRRRHGAPANDVEPMRFVAFVQNHDQIGNRAHGDRLTSHLSEEQHQLAAAALLLGPFTPLLFMGEEYGEPAPFPYFVSHSDDELIEAVRRGRAQEFAGFTRIGEPPDPCAETTFRSALLTWSLRESGHHAKRLAFYTKLLAIRKEIRSLRPRSFEEIETHVEPEALTLRVTSTTDAGATALYLNFSDRPTTARIPAAGDAATWRVRLDTGVTNTAASRVTDATALPGSSLELAPHSAVLLLREAHPA